MYIACRIYAEFFNKDEYDTFLNIFKIALLTNKILSAFVKQGASVRKFGQF